MSTLTLSEYFVCGFLVLCAAGIGWGWRWLTSKPSPNRSESPKGWRWHPWPDEPEHYNNRCTIAPDVGRFYNDFYKNSAAPSLFDKAARPSQFRLERSGGYDSVYDREHLKGRVIIRPIEKTTGAIPPPGSKPKLN